MTWGVPPDYVFLRMIPSWFLIESDLFLSILARILSILEELLELY